MSPPQPLPSDPDVSAAILEIWREVLGDPALGPRDDFFALGGDSIRGALIVSRIRRRLGVRVSLRVLLSDGSTVEELARIVMRPPHGA